MCAHINTPFSTYAAPFGWVKDFGFPMWRGLMEVVVLEREDYDVPPPPPPPQIHSISSQHPSGSTAARRITKRGLAVTSH